MTVARRSDEMPTISCRNSDLLIIGRNENIRGTNQTGRTMMIAGERVRIRPDSFLRTRHPELANAVGVVSSTMHRNGDALLHVRFAAQNVVALNTLATHFETVDRLELRLRAI